MQFQNLSNDELYMLTILLVVLILSLSLFLLLIRFKKNMLIKEKELKAQLTEANITSLLARINPHFLFNTVGSLMSVVQFSDKAQTLQYMEKFAKLLRYTLEKSDMKSASVHDEVELLTYYIELEKLRHNNQFKFFIHVAPEIDQYNTDIPVMIVQPFIENALLHGLHSKIRATHNFVGELLVSYTKEGNKIICSIKDNGVGRSKSSQTKKTGHSSKGTRFTEMRLELLSKNTCKIKYNDLWCHLKGEALGTEVIVELPIIN